MKKKKTVLAIDDVIDKYADMVYRISFAATKKEDDAQDVFQEVFLRLTANLHKLESEEHIKAWLIRVTANCAKKHFSSYWNRNVSSMTDMEIEEPGVCDNYEAVEGNPVTQAVKELPEKYRIPVHLFYYEQLSIQEIAKALDMKESTVKSHLFRGRELLKSKLEGEVVF